MKGQLNVTTPKEYIAKLEEPRRTDIATLDQLIRKTAPKLESGIGGGLLGYGPYHYKYASGREGDSFRIAIASNANYISLYAMGADDQGYVAERFKSRLPKANIGKCCVRFKRVADLDLDALTDLIRLTANTPLPEQIVTETSTVSKENTGAKKAAAAGKAAVKKPSPKKKTPTRKPAPRAS